MFYSCFLESVERWPTAPAVEIQRQPGASTSQSPLSSFTTAADGHTIESFTYRQLRRFSDGVGQWLIRSGIGAGVAGGTRCAILAFNSPSWVAIYLGIIASGNTAVPLDTAFTAYQVGKLLDDCGATLLFVDERSFAVAREAVAGRPIELVTIDQRHEGLPCVQEMVLASQPGFVPVTVKPGDVSAIKPCPSFAA